MGLTHRFVFTVIVSAAALLPLPSMAQAQRGHGHVRVAAPVVVTGGFYYRYYDPFWGSYGPWWGPWGGPYYYGAPYREESAVRLQVTPRETEVFVDGYYAGTVDDFDGFSQRLRLDPGEHRIDLYLDGHRAVSQTLFLQRGQTYRIRHAMEALPAGEAAPARPTPSATAAPPPPSPQRGERRGPPPPPARADRGAAASGSALLIRVQPADAVVLIDGQRWEGAAAGAGLEVQLSPGPHRVEVQREGYQTYATTVDVRPGPPTPLNISLTRQQYGESARKR